jgi:PKD domain
VARRLSSVVPFVVLVSLCLATAPSAFAAGTTPTISFGHDDTRDGDEAGNREIHSGLFAAFNYDATLQPDAQRADSVANANEIGGTNEDNPTYEKFPFDVPAGDENGSFTVAVTWQEPAIDMDVYVYRQRPNGTLDPSPVASSASTADPERATRFEPIAGDPIKAGRYWVYVDNWCSNDTDPFVVRFFDGSCTGNPDAPLSNIDEDDFVGQVTFTAFSKDNALPSAGLSGPDTGATGQDLTFTGSGSDTDGTISNYSFDLDGDGRFEYDNAKNPTVTTRFPNAGVYNVGVRVADDRGGTAYASKSIAISGPSSGTTGPGGKPAALGLLSSFKLNRPVFGGKKNSKLVVRYRLREAGRAILSLYRGKTRIKRLSSGKRVANHTYRINISPKKLRKGATYTVRMFAQSSDGKRTQSVRLSAKRL